MAPSPDNGTPNNSETIEAALIRIGDEAYLGHLSPQLKALTKKQIMDLLNANFSTADTSKVSVDTIGELWNLAKGRIKEGKSVFPWDVMDEIKILETNIGGGFW